MKDQLTPFSFTVEPFQKFLASPQGQIEQLVDGAHFHYYLNGSYRKTCRKIRNLQKLIPKAQRKRPNQSNLSDVIPIKQLKGGDDHARIES